MTSRGWRADNLINNLTRQPCFHGILIERPFSDERATFGWHVGAFSESRVNTVRRLSAADIALQLASKYTGGYKKKEIYQRSLAPLLGAAASRQKERGRHKVGFAWVCTHFHDIQIVGLEIAGSSPRDDTNV